MSKIWGLAKFMMKTLKLFFFYRLWFEFGPTAKSAIRQTTKILQAY